MNWISVNDRLPDKEQMVIAFTKSGEFVFGVIYNEEEKSFFNIHTECKEYVTHWAHMVSPTDAEGN